MTDTSNTSLIVGTNNTTYVNSPVISIMLLLVCGSDCGSVPQPLPLPLGLAVGSLPPGSLPLPPPWPLFLSGESSGSLDPMNKITND